MDPTGHSSAMSPEGQSVPPHPVAENYLPLAHTINRKACEVPYRLTGEAMHKLLVTKPKAVSPAAPRRFFSDFGCETVEVCATCS